jgi:hypothetical protein
MIFVEVKWDQPTGRGNKTFVFNDNEVGEKWGKRLSDIRQSLPFSSIIDKVKIYDSVDDELGFSTQNELIWESGI